MRLDRVIQSVLVLATIAATAVGASAQTLIPAGSIDALKKDAKVRIGRLYLTPFLTIDNAGLDTNVFNTTTDPVRDFTMTVTPRADGLLPIAHRALVDAKVGTGFVYFKKYSEERSIDPTIDVLTELFFSRLTLFGGLNHLNSRQRVSLEIDARARRRETDLRLGAAYQLRPKLAMVVSGHRRDFSFDGDEFFFGTNLDQSLSRNERGFGVELRNTLTAKTTLVLKSGTQRTRFDFSTNKNADTFRTTIGLELKPRALINGSGEVGAMSFTPVNKALAGFKGLVAKGALGSTILGSTRLGLDLERDVGFSFDPATPYYVTNSVGGNIRRQLFRDSDVIVRALRQSSNYRAFGGKSDVVRQDVTHSYGADLGYRLTRDARIGFAITKWTRSSSISGSREYSGFRIGMSMVYGLQQQ